MSVVMIRVVSRRRVIVLVLLVVVVAAVVFRHELERVALVAVSGGLCWRLLLGPSRRRRGSRLESVRRWGETLMIGWIAANVPRARRARIDPSSVMPIGSLQPVYHGRFAETAAGRRSSSSSSQGDDIPF